MHQEEKFKMSEQLIIQQCSPTLAGLKTGNLFLVEMESREQLKEEIRRINQRLCRRGIRMIPMKYNKGKALVYLYRVSKLKEDLNNSEAKKILEKMGYVCHDPEKCIIHLKERLENFSEFPHEIGLFLGYPPEDVKGFIENKAENFKCIGTWKVYGNEKQAKKKFSQFKKCIRIYSEQWMSGRTIEQLTVAM